MERVEGLEITKMCEGVKSEIRQENKKKKKTTKVEGKWRRKFKKKDENAT